MDKIACIGSRDTTPEKIQLMEQIGRYIASTGAAVASGNAQGSDQAFARGANSIDPTHVFLYLPWSSYEAHAIVDGNRRVGIISEEAKKLTMEVAAKYHPAWEHLSDAVKTLMQRNAAIVLKSKAVISNLNHDKKGLGGTGHGWRIAEGYNIPRIDISGPDISFEQVKAFLESR